jgi:putative membrane protein
MWKDLISFAWRGMAMGMAEVVPGVSGGTIAFITGIYERLIKSIRNISLFPVQQLRKGGFSQLWRHIDGNFLLALLAGMVVGLVIGIFGISYLLEHYPPLIWGFFFGLIVASVVYIGKKISSWKWVEVLLLIGGTVIAYFITVFSPSEGSQSYPFIFVSGMIAICALILPGISGSFILLLLGMYTFILESVKAVIEDQSLAALMITGVFALGCLVGLALFSNVLNWTFKYYRHPTLALLTGFMIGSLNRIWPWRNPVLWLDKDSGKQLTDLSSIADLERVKVLSELNVFPSAYHGDALFAGVIVFFFLGLLLVFLFSRWEKTTVEF